MLLRTKKLDCTKRKGRVHINTDHNEIQEPDDDSKELMDYNNTSLVERRLPRRTLTTEDVDDEGRGATKDIA